MKIKKDTLYNVTDLIGILEKLRTKATIISNDLFSKEMWGRYMADVFDSDTKQPTKHIEFIINDKYYMDVKLKVIEYGDETFIIKDITCKIEKY